VSRSTYAALFGVIGTSHGSGDGSSTFNLPDYRGRFLRGVDGAAGHDPDAAARAASSPGGNTGNEVGTCQSESFHSHTHAVSDPGHAHNPDPGTNGFAEITPENVGNLSFTKVAQNAGVNFGQPSSTASAFTNIGIGAAGGSETRPTNISVNYLIRYQ
jgi:microcystin-dependent protein